MGSSAHGIGTSTAEVTHISAHGIWILLADAELFLPYDHFPWFRDAPVSKILRVEEPSPGHFYWPELNVDLARECIEHPERFPLVADVPRRQLLIPTRDEVAWLGRLALRR